MGRETLRTGGKILTDIAKCDDVSAGDKVSKHVTVTTQKMIIKLRGRGRKRGHGGAVAGGKEKWRRKEFKHAPRKIIKGTFFPGFTSVTLQQSVMSAAAEITSVSSEFDVFAHRPIQTSVLGTKEVAYKPIAPVDQNELEFLIT